MFDLIAPKKKRVSFVIIDDFGALNSISGELEYYINSDSTHVYDTFEHVIANYAENINVLSGYSAHNILHHSELSTDKFTIKTDSMLTHNKMFMSYLGNIVQAFTDSIKHEMSSSMNAVNNSFSTIFVNFKRDDTLTTLINATRNGVKIKTVEFNVEHAPRINNSDYSNAVSVFDGVLNDLNSVIIYNDDHIDKDFFISGAITMQSQMNFDDNASISESIYNDLYTVAKHANITKLSIIEK